MVKKTPSKKAPATSKKASSKSIPAQQDPSLSSNLQTSAEQQRLLNIFSDAFSNVLSSELFPTLLQEVKQALFNREFATAFGREDYLEAYAARWSPTRALCYASVFLSIQKHLSKIVGHDQDGDELKPAEENSLSSGDVVKDKQATNENTEVSPPSTKAGKSGKLRMVCIGGCAAEHLAFASYLESQSLVGRLTLLDSGPWSSVTALLEAKTNSPPPISKYASAAAKASNRPLLEAHQLCLAFKQQDILDLDAPSLAAVLGDKPTIVTLMFTLNELYTSEGISKTTKLLKNLGQELSDGSLLLVVDSPGSYSEAAVGKDKKKYPMQWLLDHTLVGIETPEYTWEKLQSNESIWFRLPDGLTYPIPLENMRYQLHLYRLEKTR
ncbi:hypothetical protein B0T10DRAFT_4327 [Thelonectria olida]|uniref:25S rRNA (Uridine(2843)-N(3))-methyltransferase n=1 Tax=Thelonectria olida TaxID=1576542 RepID=A0A9P9ATD6_9HYPO|nr:hypothetical protein B0T10DRAFT_4327 [Thelonectria olida]